ncbi:hypothetical protein CF327_g4973 [Tilletia walkeri]|uniref:ferroxidase n=1 Tax=Tilletia walkeri TaxID=117179 RepID=A0A8X7N7W1_9BASI|nr:hypothetical protein CF327_g4973 [Tilletia walkeri]KAE8267639.1 hypothetical protein A4X09_0g4699 [Tilletia walkeri]
MREPSARLPPTYLTTSTSSSPQNLGAAQFNSKGQKSKMLPTRLLAQRIQGRPTTLTRNISPSSPKERGFSTVRPSAASSSSSTSIPPHSSRAQAPISSRRSPIALPSSRPFTHSAPLLSSSSQQPLTPEEYDTKASQTLESLTDSLEILLESLLDSTSKNKITSPAEWDVEYSSGVLNLRLGPQHGTYVVNKQPPNKQIWLSSPTSGPKRFDYERAREGGEGERWVWRKGGGEPVTLKGLLEGELAVLTGLKADELGLRFEADD